MSELSPDVKRDQAKQEAIKSFLEVMGALDEYNQAHGMGAMMAGTMLSEIEPGGSERRQAEREELVRAALAKRDQANALGLDFDFTERKSTVMFGHPEDVVSEGIRPKELRLMITDAPQFLRFLQTLDADDLQRQPTLQEKFGSVINVLIQQMVENYNPGKLDDPRWRTMLENAAFLIVEFDRLGMGDRTRVLEQYMANSRRGTLVEYRGLMATQSFQEPGSGGFGPSEWHTDTNIEQYEERWKKAYDALLRVLQNERATPPLAEAIDNLIACANWAIADMERRLAQPIVDAHEDKVLPGCIDIARKYKEQLGQLKEGLEISPGVGPS